MTDEERARLIEAKEDITRRLRDTDFRALAFTGCDTRIEEYVAGVCRNPESHNIWEQLAVGRFIDMSEKYGFDSTAVRKFFYFYEQLYFPGKKGMQQYRLTPVQAFQFASVFGFYNTEGLRVVRECVLYVPRKFSKTTGTAAFALWDLVMGDSNAEIYIGANSQTQAKKCFDVIRGALRKLDTQGKRFVVNQTEVKPTRSNHRQSFAQCLTANARTKDGMNASTVIMDEFSQARDSELLTVLTTSMGVRDNPLTVIITTASDVFDGPFYSMLNGYKQLLLGDYEDDTVFCHLFEPDVDDAEDDPATWRKVHPHLGITVKDDFYEKEYKKAQRNGAEAMLAFRTKLLNIYTENEQRSWIPAQLIRDHQTKIEVSKLPKRMLATLGIDLSVRDDFSAVSVGIYDPEGAMFGYHTAYFFPRGGLSGHPNETLYRKWAADGHLIIQEGDVIDYEGIVEYILELAEYLDIATICYDPAKSLDFINMLATTELARTLYPFKQTNFHFTSAVQSFEVQLRTGHIGIDSNPINAYCFGNAVVITDSMGNMKPYKRTQTGKIDGVITMLMAHKAFERLERLVY